MIINEIFQSIDGEVNHWGQGMLSIFIRLGGCNLKCSYCDTPDTQTTNSSKEMSIEEIIKQVPMGMKVTITGGEPLLQSKELKELIIELARFNYNIISIESNGTIPIITDFGDDLLNRNIRKRISWVLDYKSSVRKSNLPLLTEMDWVKFPITSRERYVLIIPAIPEIKRHRIRENSPSYPTYTEKCIDLHFNIAFSPIDPVTPSQLMRWLLEDKQYNIRVNLQLHKLAGLK